MPSHISRSHVHYVQQTHRRSREQQMHNANQTMEGRYWKKRDPLTCSVVDTLGIQCPIAGVEHMWNDASKRGLTQLSVTSALLQNV